MAGLLYFEAGSNYSPQMHSPSNKTQREYFNKLDITSVKNILTQPSQRLYYVRVVIIAAMR